MNIANFWPCVLFLAGSIGVLQAEDLVTGPPAGTTITPIKSYANSGPFAGREYFDAAAEIGDGPGAFLFIHLWNRNMTPVLRGMDNLTAEFELFGFKSFIISLTDDRSEGENRLQRVNGSLKLNNPIILSLDGLEGPGNYALNRRCVLSLVVVNDGKVIESLSFLDVGKHDLPRLREAIEKAIGELPVDETALLGLAKSRLPDDKDALRELAARQAVELYHFNHQATEDYLNTDQYATKTGKKMQRGRKEMKPDGKDRPMTGARAASANDRAKQTVRRGAAPDDSQLNGLLRSYIRKNNDDGRIDEIFAEIQERSVESEDLNKQIVAMFQLMLSYPDNYGSEYAQKQARRFLKEHGEE